MNKFKKATKRIVAIGFSTLMVSSLAFAGGLANYPTNFVNNGKFTGTVVYGANANAMDTTSASAVISNLEDLFSGNKEQVEISYKKTSTAGNGESINAVRSNQELNYGESIGDVTETSGFDDSDTSVLDDDEFKNGISDEDYEQTLTLDNGEFNYALRDDMSEIDDAVYYDSGDAFATYALDLKTALDLSDTDDLDKDMVGKTLTIMGNEFTIASISVDTGTPKHDLTKIELLGGANKVSLDEGQTVTVDGKTVGVSRVSSDKAYVTVGSNSGSVDLYDTAEIGGVSIALTDVFEGTDRMAGTAELVVGGQKITMTDGDKLVEINNDDIDDVYPAYDVYSDFIGDGLDKIQLTYKVDDDTILKEGDSLKDVLFQAFSLVYEGTNEVTYSTVELKVDDDDLQMTGTTVDGQDFDRTFMHLTNKDSAGNMAYLVGKDDADRFYYKYSDLVGEQLTFTGTWANLDTVTSHIAVDGAAPVDVLYTATGADTTQIATGLATAINDDNSLNTKVRAISNGAVVNIFPIDAITVEATETVVTAGDGDTTDSASQITFDLTDNDIKGNGFLVYHDNEEQYLYEITSVDTDNVGADDDHEVDFDEYLRDASEDAIADTEWNTQLGTNIDGVTNPTDDSISLNISDLGDTIAFENELLLQLDANSEQLDSSLDMANANFAELDFSLDTPDVDADDANIEGTDGVTISIGRDDSDKEFDIKKVELNNPNVAEFVNDGMEDNSDDNSDWKTYATGYGMKVVYDNDEKQSVKIMTPDKEVQADVQLVFGDVGNTETGSVIVDSTDVEAKKADLIKQGYTITGTDNVVQDKVDFTVSAPVLDSDVTGMDDLIVVGGPAVNAKARALMGISTYTIDQAGVEKGDAIIKYFEDSNSVLVYGYDGADTARAVEELNAGGLSGDSVNVN